MFAESSNSGRSARPDVDHEPLRTMGDVMTEHTVS